MGPGEAEQAAAGSHSRPISSDPGLLALARPLAVVFVAGALAGTLLDQIHVIGRVLHYPSPGPLGPPWWVFGQYGLAAAGFVAPWRDLARKFGIDTPGRWRDLGSPLAWFVASYAATALFQRWELLVALGLFGTWLVRALRDGGWRVVAYSLGIAAIGVGWESYFSGLGLFVYDAPRSWVVPVWLPALYCQAALLTRQMARLILPR